MDTMFIHLQQLLTPPSGCTLTVTGQFQHLTLHIDQYTYYRGPMHVFDFKDMSSTSLRNHRDS